MGLFIIFILAILTFVAHRKIRQKWHTPKRGWYRHKSKKFAFLYYSLFIIYVISIFTFSEVNFFFVFPLVGGLVNLIFAWEQFLYNKESKIYLHYFVDSIFWILAGAVALIFVPGVELIN
ncbi:DUF4181 domain-containing protein [Cytobacillus sp. FJAT-54145]|uniref:DUF4181 domain-containing protein n=1 Tax=Cytobacillus spartinae TaxID=3299023 RepID=A0ABW6KAN7_9BACI